MTYRQWDVPEFAQSSPNRCWEACGRMLFHWRHASQSDQNKAYVKAAGDARTKEVMHVSEIHAY